PRYDLQFVEVSACRRPWGPPAGQPENRRFATALKPVASRAQRTRGVLQAKCNGLACIARARMMEAVCIAVQRECIRFAFVAKMAAMAAAGGGAPPPCFAQSPSPRAGRMGLPAPFRSADQRVHIIRSDADAF